MGMSTLGGVTAVSTTIAMPFDTLAFVKKLEASGIPSAQAEAQVEMLSDVIKKVEETRLQELATKGDIRESELKLETKIESAVGNAKVEIIKWVAGLFVAQTALVFGVLFATGRMGQPTMQPTMMYQSPTQEMRQTAPVQSVPSPAPLAPSAPPTTPAH